MVGVVLMIVITVIIAAMVAAYVFGLTGRTSGPNATLNVKASRESDTKIKLTIIHEGGDALDTNSIIVYAQDNMDEMKSIGDNLATWQHLPDDNVLNAGQQCDNEYVYGKKVKVGMTITVRIVHDPSGTLLFDGTVTVKK